MKFYVLKPSPILNIYTFKYSNLSTSFLPFPTVIFVLVVDGLPKCVSPSKNENWNF